ncbi:hypothetical protein BHE74_00019295 [Ensete ventricosum]|nr:hypothetical protein BHE74_00019295 [Ensete ventricosum]RZS00956.1 hypothetical protein BHM03_00030769 [Ensete ventricosum]
MWMVPRSPWRAVVRLRVAFACILDWEPCGPKRGDANEEAEKTRQGHKKVRIEKAMEEEEEEDSMRWLEHCVEL